MKEKKLLLNFRINFRVQFDSGGPVLWENPLTEDVMVVGIISYGKGCANFEPSVNTRVSSFIDWIEEVTSGTCNVIKILFTLVINHDSKETNSVLSIQVKNFAKRSLLSLMSSDLNLINSNSWGSSCF